MLKSNVYIQTDRKTHLQKISRFLFRHPFTSMLLFGVLLPLLIIVSVSIAASLAMLLASLFIG